MESEFATYAIESFEAASNRFQSDMAALSHDDLDRKWGDTSRRGYDVVYELGILHKRSAQTLRGEDPGPPVWKFGEEWVQAPDEMRDQERATAFFADTAQDLLASARSKAESASGEEAMKLFKSLNFAAMHTGYHDAQLNFIQSLKGDLAVHW